MHNMKAKHIITMIAMAVSAGASAQSIGIKLDNMNKNAKPGTDW